MKMDIIYSEKPNQDDRNYLDDKLMGFNGDKIKGYAFNNFLYKVTDDSGSIIAGIDCIFGGGWLEVISLWVSDNHRGKNIGEKLLLKAEKMAIKRGCHSSYLYTYSFQAPEFYQNYGYEIFGVLDNYYECHSKIYLKKKLG